MRAKIQILLQLTLETPVPEVTRVLLRGGCPVALIPSYERKNGEPLFVAV
jgi:hypothetical protein